MPTTANTKVIVESLDQTYTQILDAFEELDSTQLMGEGEAVFIE